MTRRIRLVVLGVGIAVVAVMMSLAFTGMQHFGGDVHAYRDSAVGATFAHGTANAVSSVNFDVRGFDTFGEETILFAPSSASLHC